MIEEDPLVLVEIEPGFIQSLFDIVEAAARVVNDPAIEKAFRFEGNAALDALDKLIEAFDGNPPIDSIE